MVAALQKHIVEPESRDAKRSTRQVGPWGRALPGQRTLTVAQALVAALGKVKHPAETLELLSIHVVRAGKEPR
jgi:hypothetical protein